MAFLAGARTSAKQPPKEKNSTTSWGGGNVRVYPKRSTPESEPLSQQPTQASKVLQFSKSRSDPYHAPSFELFNDQYAKAGIQPSGLSGADDNQSAGGPEKAQRSAQKQAEYEESLEAAAYQEELFEQQQAAFSAEKIAAVSDLQNQIRGGTAGNGTTQAAALALNTPTALWMTAWHTWAYLTFQLPLAILCLMLFAMAAAVESTWLTRQFGSLLSYVSLDPKTLFLVVNTALWGLSFLGLIATMFTYLIRGQSPVHGDRATAKYLSIIGCLFGYGFPFFNLFPWIGIYIFVMWTSRD